MILPVFQQFLHLNNSDWKIVVLYIITIISLKRSFNNPVSYLLRETTLSWVIFNKIDFLRFLNIFAWICWLMMLFTMFSISTM